MSAGRWPSRPARAGAEPSTAEVLFWPTVGLCVVLALFAWGLFGCGSTVTPDYPAYDAGQPACAPYISPWGGDDGGCVCEPWMVLLADGTCGVPVDAGHE